MNRTAFYAAFATSALLAPAAAHATAFAVNTDDSNFTNILYDGSTPCVFNPTSPSAAPLQCLGPSDSDINRIEWPGGTLKTMHGPAATSPGASGIAQYFTGEYVANPGVNATQVQIGGLQMTTGNHPGSSATFDYNLVIQITAPTGSVETETYDLGVTTTAISGGPGGTNTLQTLISGLIDPISVEGPGGEVFTLSDFTWSEVDCTTGLNNGGTSCAPVSASYVNGAWSVTSNGSGEISDLILSADVTVPEPGTLAILASGLGLLGMVRRRRARKS